MASRKRINAELAQFRQKVSRENADIIKIKQLRQQIDDARAGARARFALLKQKCRERRQKLEELHAVVAERQRELELKSGTAARLMADLAAEARARYRAESALRAKDDELAQQTAIILELRADKERHQEPIAELQATMENVGNELTGPARPQVQTPAERDADDLLFGFLSDGAVDSDALEERHQEPIAELQATTENVGNELTGPARPQVQAPAERDADDLLFGFLSDDSEDSDVLDERQQEKIAELQATMENVHKALTGPARPQVQTPAERDADDLLFGFLSDGAVDSDALEERQQEKIAELQATMENVHKALTGPARPQVQTPAERDADDLLFGFLSDGAVDSDALEERHEEPIAELQATTENVGNELTGPARPQVQAPAERDADDLLFSFLSDDTEDSNVVHSREVHRRFEVMLRGERFSRIAQLKKELGVKNRKNRRR